MPRNQHLARRKSSSLEIGKQPPRESDENASRPDSRRLGSNRERACVLVGSAMLQLPIWGFAMTYGVFEDYYTSNWTLKGNLSATGIIGTTTNGVMYLSMPWLFALFTRRLARWRQTAALCGAALTCISFLLSSFSTDVWHLVAMQGILAAFGCALVYSPTTLSLGEWYRTTNRAVAYGVVLSSKNLVGSVCPFIMRILLDRYGFRVTLRIWAGITAGSSILAIFLVPTHPSTLSATLREKQNIPKQFLKHQSFYMYGVATMLQSAGYGIPQTYLGTYAREVALLPQTSATLLLALFNVPGILGSAFFGYLTDNKYYPLSATTVTTISACSSALSAMLLWGLTSQGSIALLVLFSLTFGFFAGSYSATWGGIINEMEREAKERNEAIDTGMVYGLLNGARGIGYVAGGLLSVPLLKAGVTSGLEGFGYGTAYGPLIIFTGLSTVFGGLGLLWKTPKLMKFVKRKYPRRRRQTCMLVLP